VSRSCLPSLIAGCLLLLGLCLSAPTVDSDYFWHLRLGRWIIEHGWTLPTVESFSHTAAGVPVIVQGWLFDALQYLADEALGITGIRCLVAALFVGTWAVVHATVRLSLNREPRAMIVTGICMLGASGFIAPRPLLATNLAFALTLFALLKFRASAQRRWLALLFPVFALWGNLHFGYLAGLALVALFALAALAERLLHSTPETASPAELRPGLAAGLLALCLVALCLNPYGAALPVETLKMAAVSADSELLEWARPDFTGLRGALFLLPLAMLALVWSRNARRPDWLDLLLTLPLVGMALASQRHIPLACIVIAPVVARALGSRAPNGKRSTGDEPPGAHRRQQGRLWAGAVVLLLASAGTVSLLPAAAERDRQTLARDYPVTALAYIREHGLAGPLLNSYRSGGFLMDQLGDLMPVFIDSRYVPFAGTVMRDHHTLTRLQPGWEALLDRYRIRLAVLGPEDRALASAMEASGRFRAVHASSGYTVLTRSE
jgi:hypothetical protein